VVQRLCLRAAMEYVDGDSVVAERDASRAEKRAHGAENSPTTRCAMRGWHLFRGIWTQMPLAL